MTNRHQCFKPIPVLIDELNRHLKGWMNYFSFGYPSSAYCEIERYAFGIVLIQHLQRRSQRPYCLPQGEQWLQHLARLGLIRPVGYCACLRRELSGRAGRGKIRISGSTRGEWVVFISPSLLLYPLRRWYTNQHSKKGDPHIRYRLPQAHSWMRKCFDPLNSRHYTTWAVGDGWQQATTVASWNHRALFRAEYVASIGATRPRSRELQPSVPAMLPSERCCSE